MVHLGDQTSLPLWPAPPIGKLEPVRSLLLDPVAIEERDSANKTDNEMD